MLIRWLRKRSKKQDRLDGYRWAAGLLLVGLRENLVSCRIVGKKGAYARGAEQALNDWESIMKPKAKWKMYDEAIAKLKERGISYELRNGSMELVFECGTQFWPTTGTLMQEGKRLDIKGVDALLEIL